MSIWNYVDIEAACSFGSSLHPTETQKKTRGRPPLTVENPLANVPPYAVLRSNGTPQQWFEDCVLGAIRITGNQDQRLKDTSRYVSFTKVVTTLLTMPSTITPKATAECMGVSLDTGWRIATVIKLAAPYIKRGLPTKHINNQINFK